MRLFVLFLAACSAFAQTHPIAVISHRGEHLHHTENTLEAYKAALDAGADYYEVDVRTTSDGKLVLMHDGSVDRTTNGTGAVAEKTFAEMRALLAGGQPVATFEEALALAHGRSRRVYVDVKNASAADLVTALERQKMLDRVVVYGGFDYLGELQQLRPDIRVMPESVSVEVVTRIVEKLKPKVIAFSARDWRPEMIRIALDAGADIYVDRLGKDDNPQSWQDAIAQGATGIQTDHPAELVEYLRSKGLHK